MSAPDEPDPDDPLQWVIDTYYSKKSPGTIDVAKLALFGTKGDTPSGGFHGVGAKVGLKPWLEERNKAPSELTVDDAYEYLSDLQSAYAVGTQHTRAQTCRKAYDILVTRNVKGFEYNPFKDVMEDHDILDPKSQKGSDNVTIYTKNQLLDVIYDQHPVNQTVSMMLLKTTRRIGGVCNLDFVDVHLDHPAADWQVHQTIRDKPDHIHFGPGASQGEVHRGEVRHDGQKTITTTLVPMDRELKDFLIWYVQMSRISEHEGAFFINPRGTEPGCRLHSEAYRDWLTPIAKDHGLYYGMRDPDNIRPHYFRHWSSSKMRDRVGSDLTDYMRGDKKKISDNYNHYTEKKAQKWRKNIPKFHHPYIE